MLLHCLSFKLILKRDCSSTFQCKNIYELYYKKPWIGKIETVLLHLNFLFLFLLKVLLKWVIFSCWLGKTQQNSCCLLNSSYKYELYFYVLLTELTGLMTQINKEIWQCNSTFYYGVYFTLLSPIFHLFVTLCQSVEQICSFF